MFIEDTTKIPWLKAICFITIGSFIYYWVNCYKLLLFGAGGAQNIWIWGRPQSPLLGEILAIQEEGWAWHM